MNATLLIILILVNLGGLFANIIQIKEVRKVLRKTAELNAKVVRLNNLLRLMDSEDTEN